MTPDSVTFVVETSQSGLRLDAFLRQRLGDVSRARIQRLIDSGFIRVNGHHAKPAYAPRAGDRIDVSWPAPRPAAASAQDLPLEILFEDEHLLVLNKAAGLVTHPAAGHEDGTLVNALLHHCAGQLSGIGGVARPGIVHRLDKGTSGCLVAAKHDAAHVALATQFAGRDVLKIYQVLVCGRVPQDVGEIRAGIARHPNHRKRMAVTSGGRPAWTSFEVRERLAAATWLHARLHTGRTHQIRVHFHHLGNPVLGDPVYGRRTNSMVTEATGYMAPRQMLHAWRLAFRHPIGGRYLEFEAPLPEDFNAAILALRAGSTRGERSKIPSRAQEAGGFRVQEKSAMGLTP